MRWGYNYYTIWVGTSEHKPVWLAGTQKLYSLTVLQHARGRKTARARVTLITRNSVIFNFRNGYIYLLIGDTVRFVYV